METIGIVANNCDFKNPNATFKTHDLINKFAYMISDNQNHENCVWFRNNGEHWHTLYKFDNGFKVFNINGKTECIFYPTLYIHVGMINHNYNIDIYFKNNDCSLVELNESFLKVDSNKIKIVNNGYVKTSAEIIDYIFNDYEFECNNLDNYIENKIVCKNLTVLSYDLDDLLVKWKSEIPSTVSNLTNRILYTRNQSLLYNEVDRALLINMLFEKNKIINMNQKKYIVNKIDIERDIDNSVKNKFENDKISMIELESGKKIILPVRRILDAQVKKYKNNRNILCIDHTDIKIGKYILDDDVYRKISKISYNAKNYMLNIDSVWSGDCQLENDYKYDVVSCKHNCGTIYDFYKIMKLSDKTIKFPKIYFITNDLIVTKKDDEIKYTLNELFELYSNFRLVNQITNRIDHVSLDTIRSETFTSIITPEQKNESKYPEYDNVELPHTSFGNKCFIEKNDIIKFNIYDNNLHTNIIFQNDQQLEDFNLITSNKDKKSFIDDLVKPYICDNVNTPCVINKKEFLKNSVYILHYENHDQFHKLVRIVNFRLNKYDLIVDLVDVYNGKNFSIDIHNHFLNYLFDDKSKIQYLNKCIFDYDGLSIGQYGRLKDVGAVNGFKKSLFYRIIAIYEKNVNNIKNVYVLFDNGISVNVNLIDIDHFNKKMKNENNINGVYYNMSDLCHLANSTKKISRHITRSNSCLIVEIN